MRPKLQYGLISEIAYSQVFDMDNYAYFDDTLTTLETLKGKYSLGIISDTWLSIDRILRKGGIEDYFATRTFSCYLGTYKPAKRMYLHALEQMNLPPEQTVLLTMLKKTWRELRNAVFSQSLLQ